MSEPIGFATGSAKRDLPQEWFATAKRDFRKYQSYMKAFRNPSDILTKTALGMQKGILLFAEMKHDPQVASCLLRIGQSVTRFPFDVLPAGGDAASPEEQRQADVIKEIIKPHYYDLVQHLLDAVPVGYSVTEILVRADDLVRISGVKKRRQERFVFDVDGALQLKLTASDFSGTPVMDRQFIVATWREEDDNRYGEAALGDAFWAWWMKKSGLMFWASYLERFGQPFALGQYPSGTEKEKKDDFLEALESIQSDFAMTMPEGFKVELVEGLRAGAAESYEAFQNYLDRMIQKALLGTAIADGGEKFGSRSANDVLLGISDDVVEAVCEFAAKTMNQTIVAWLADWNFGTSTPPQLVIQYRSKQISPEQATAISSLATAGVPIPLAAVCEAAGWAVPQDGDLVIQGQRVQPFTTGLPSEDPNPGATGGVMPVLGSTEGVVADTALNGAQIQSLVSILTSAAQQQIPLASVLPVLLAAYPSIPEATLKRIADSLKGFSPAAPAAASGEFAEAAKTPSAITKINRAIDALAQPAVAALAKAADIRSAIGAAKDWKSALAQVDRYESKGLETELRNVVELGRWLGEYQARVTSPDAQFAAKGDDEIELDDKFSYLKPTDAIAWLRKKIPVKRDVYKELSGATKQAAFHISGVPKLIEQIWVKEKMLQALENGWTYDQFRLEFYRATGAVEYTQHLETAFFTNLYQALGAQNYAALQRAGIEWYRYSAILDDATRPDHAAMHGYIARADDPIWDTWYPPNGYNCRCRVTAASPADVEAFDPGRYRDVTSLRPDDGFEQNPARQDTASLKSLLKDKKEYSENLDGAIQSWLYRLAEGVKK